MALVLGQGLRDVVQDIACQPIRNLLLVSILLAVEQLEALNEAPEAMAEARPIVLLDEGSVIAVATTAAQPSEGLKLGLKRLGENATRTAAITWSTTSCPWRSRCDRAGKDLPGGARLSR